MAGGYAVATHQPCCSRRCPRLARLPFFDRTGRFPFHQVGQPPGPRHVCPREQVFHPPEFRSSTMPRSYPDDLSAIRSVRSSSRSAVQRLGGSHRARREPSRPVPGDPWHGLRGRLSLSSGVKAGKPVPPTARRSIQRVKKAMRKEAVREEAMREEAVREEAVAAVTSQMASPGGLPLEAARTDSSRGSLRSLGTR